MATITDPDLLLDATVDSNQNIFIDTANRTIKIRDNKQLSGANRGPILDPSGVTHQALYSFLKEEWKNDPKNKELIAYPFPLVAITPEQFEWRFGWKPADETSRQLIRTGGWREFDVDNETLKREYVGTISLGNIQGSQDGADSATVAQHTVYYAFFDSDRGFPRAGPFDYNFAGEVNQAVQTYDSAAFDRRQDILRLFIRAKPYDGTQPQDDKAWTFDQTDTTDIGVVAGAQLPYNTQRFPLVEGEDLNVKDRDGANLTDAIIEANDAAGQKYSRQGDGPTIEYLTNFAFSNTFGYTQDLLNGPFPYSTKISATSPTAGQLQTQELYSWVQYNLRQDSDIEPHFSGGAKIGVKSGKLADELLSFVGSTLTTQLSTNLDRYATDSSKPLKGGVAITDIRPADINSVQLRDDSDTLRAFPFSSTVTITFSNDILLDSDQGKAFVYYDYTRNYTGTNIQLSAVGPAQTFGTSTYDSATITLTGFSNTPFNTTGVVATVQNPNGLVTTTAQGGTDADAYFKIVGATNTDNNVIFGVTKIYDSSTASVITLDDTPGLTNETITTGHGLRTHPINSPSSLKVDSAGAPSENGGGVVSLLATGGIYQGSEDALNAADELIFSYAYDGNTQKDRVAGADAAIIIRAIGLSNGSWVEQRATITRTSNVPVSVISAVERNYNNPA